MKHIKKFLRYISAALHIRDQDVCEFSKEMGMYDFHDYMDDSAGLPWHMCNMKCSRCGKEFMI